MYGHLALLPLVAMIGCTSGPEEDSGVAARGELVGLGLAPFDPNIARGETVQLFAEGFFDDNSHEDLTADVSWSTSDERLVVVNADGLAQGIEVGQATVIATTDGGVSAKITVTVRTAAAEVTAVQISPPKAEVEVDDKAQFSAIADLADGTTGNVSSSCTWSTGDDSIATIDTTGRATGVGSGTTSVDAVCGAFTPTAAEITVFEQGFGLPSPDLAIGFFDVTVNGGEAELSAVVNNVGDGYAADFNVEFFLDPSGTPGPNTPAAMSLWIPGLGAGLSNPVQFTLEDLDEGDHTVWVAADLDERTADPTQRNNIEGPISFTIQAGTSVTGADLVVTDFYGISDTVDTLWGVEFENQGDEAADAFWVDLFYDTTSTPQEGDLGDDYLWVPSLAPGESYIWEPELGEGPQSGTWSSCAYVDSSGSITESSETNNVMCADVEVF